MLSFKETKLSIVYGEIKPDDYFLYERGYIYDELNKRLFYLTQANCIALEVQDFQTLLTLFSQCGLTPQKMTTTLSPEQVTVLQKCCTKESICPLNPYFVLQHIFDAAVSGEEKSVSQGLSLLPNTNLLLHIQPIKMAIKKAFMAAAAENQIGVIRCFLTYFPTAKHYRPSIEEILEECIRKGYIETVKALFAISNIGILGEYFLLLATECKRADILHVFFVFLALKKKPIADETIRKMYCYATEHQLFEIIQLIEEHRKPLAMELQQEMIEAATKDLVIEALCNQMSRLQSKQDKKAILRKAVKRAIELDTVDVISDLLERYPFMKENKMLFCQHAIEYKKAEILRYFLNESSVLLSSKQKSCLLHDTARKDFLEGAIAIHSSIEENAPILPEYIQMIKRSERLYSKEYAVWLNAHYFKISLLPLSYTYTPVFNVVKDPKALTASEDIPSNNNMKNENAKEITIFSSL